MLKKKKSYTLNVREKIISPEIWGKKFLPKPDHPYPPPPLRMMQCCIHGVI